MPGRPGLNFELRLPTLAVVSDALPFVTIIVPTRPGHAEIAAVTAARALEYPKDRLEILVARGNQPAIQRNAALCAARGDLIYFLDDDSVAHPDNLRRALVHFRDPQVKMLGGPNLCPAEAPARERIFAVVLASWLAFGPSRARYDAVGKTRVSSEKELILCNMMGRRADLIELGGFDESLYPNEENALMDDLQKRGGMLIYDPQFVVHRRPRPTLQAFCKMLVTYGRGRAEQFRLHPTPGSTLNFVPPLFCLYLPGRVRSCRGLARWSSRLLVFTSWRCCSRLWSRCGPRDSSAVCSPRRCWWPAMSFTAWGFGGALAPGSNPLARSR